MTDPVVVPAPVPATPAPAAPAQTLGQTLDADVAALKARVAVLEGNVKSFWTKQIAWLEANWPHLVTWVLSGAAVAKSGILAAILKL